MTQRRASAAYAGGQKILFGPVDTLGFGLRLHRQISQAD
jgi:hypothetical protein